MPAKVDADDRRHGLVLAAAALIAEEGIGALTNQRIAERLGASTTVVTHYFRSKRELVLIFLAVLELVKELEIRLAQSEMFGDIIITKREYI